MHTYVRVYTVKPLKKGHIGEYELVPFREVPLLRGYVYIFCPIFEVNSGQVVCPL